jgi:hypothetical protein
MLPRLGLIDQSLAGNDLMSEISAEVMTQAYQEEKTGKPSTVRDQTSRNFSDRA